VLLTLQGTMTNNAERQWQATAATKERQPGSWHSQQVFRVDAHSMTLVDC
jgi:hypothetical protein